MVALRHGNVSTPAMGDAPAVVAVAGVVSGQFDVALILVWDTDWQIVVQSALRACAGVNGATWHKRGILHLESGRYVRLLFGDDLVELKGILGRIGRDQRLLVITIDQHRLRAKAQATEGVLADIMAATVARRWDIQ